MDLLYGFPAPQSAGVTCHRRRVMRDSIEYLLRGSRERRVQQLGQLLLNVRKVTEFGSDPLKLVSNPRILFQGLV